MERKTLLAISADVAQVKSLAALVESSSWDVIAVEPAAALRAARRGPAILFLPSLDPSAVRTIQDLSRDGPVAVALADADRNAAVRIMKAGACDVLGLPLTREEVARVLSAGSDAQASRIWAFVGAAGGSGVTTAAVNVADHLARSGTGAVLADLCLELGCLSQFLDLKTRFTIADVARNAERLDAAYLNGTLCVDASGLRVLPAPAKVDECDELTPERLRIILDEARAVYRHTVLDLPRTLDERTVQALDRADAILLLVPLDIPGLFAARRLCETFERLGYAAGKVRLVVARHGRKGDVRMQEAIKALPAPAWHVLADDAGAARAAMNAGRPLAEVAPRSALTLSIAALATRLRSDLAEQRTTQPQGVRRFLSLLQKEA